MDEVDVAEGIVPLGQFKTQASRYLRHLREGSTPLVVTQNGRPAAVLLSPAAYQALREREAELEAVATGLADAEAGRIVAHGVVEKWLTSWGRPDERRPPA